MAHPVSGNSINIGISGLMYGVDSSNNQILNAVSVNGNGAITTTAGGTSNVTLDGVTDGVTTNGSVTSATTVLTFANTVGYSYITFAFTSVGSGCTIVVDSAPDGSNYNGAVQFYSFGNNPTNPTIAYGSPTTNQIFVAPVVAPAMRIRVSVYGSGTVTAYGTLKRGAMPAPPLNNVGIIGNVQIAGNIASGSADSGNPVKIGGLANISAASRATAGQRVDMWMGVTGAPILGAVNGGLSGDNLVSIGLLSLADSGTGTGILGTTGYVFNGTNWARNRNITQAVTAADGVGVQATGSIGQYNSTLPTLTTGQYGVAQLDSRGGLVTTIKSSAGTAGAIVAGSLGDSAGFQAGLYCVPQSTIFNGTNWDRVRSIQGALADGTGLGVTAVEEAGALFTNITTAATTTVKSGKGILHKIIINTFVASATITMYDNTTGSGTKIGTITNPGTLLAQGPNSATYDLQFSTGLTIVTTGTNDITVVYR